MLKPIKSKIKHVKHASSHKASRPGNQDGMPYCDCSSVGCASHFGTSYCAKRATTRNADGKAVCTGCKAHNQAVARLEYHATLPITAHKPFVAWK